MPQLNTVIDEAEHKIRNAIDSNELEQIRLCYLGKKGLMTALSMEGMIATETWMR